MVLSLFKADTPARLETDLAAARAVLAQAQSAADAAALDAEDSGDAAALAKAGEAVAEARSRVERLEGALRAARQRQEAAEADRAADEAAKAAKVLAKAHKRLERDADEVRKALAALADSTNRYLATHGTLVALEPRGSIKASVLPRARDYLGPCILHALAHIPGIPFSGLDDERADLTRYLPRAASIPKPPRQAGLVVGKTYNLRAPAESAPAVASASASAEILENRVAVQE